MSQFDPTLDPQHEAESSKTGAELGRQYVRLYYPENCSKKYLPELIIRYRSYQVLDISESGIRFQVPNMKQIQDDILTGVVKFPNEFSFDISGVVVRRANNQIAMKLIVGIPYSFILTEQVRLRTLAASGEIVYNEKKS
jgi:hypothetical protein